MESFKLQACSSCQHVDPKAPTMCEWTLNEAACVALILKTNCKMLKNCEKKLRKILVHFFQSGKMNFSTNFFKSSSICDRYNNA